MHYTLCKRYTGLSDYLLMHADTGQAQQQLLLSELKRVGTQQEQLKKAVSEAAAAATVRGITFEISPLKSFKLSDEELANLKGSQLKERLAPSVAPASEEAVQVAAAENNVALAAPAGKLSVAAKCCCDAALQTCGLLTCYTVYHPS